MTTHSKIIRFEEDRTASLKRKAATWALNTVAALLLGFQLALTAKDPATLLVIAFCHVIALGLAYASVRIRFNVMGLLLFFLSGVLYFAFLVQLFLTRFPFKPF